MATQNPIEQEGTYPLPEAQRDRFLFQVIVDYPSRDEESLIIDRTTSAFQAKRNRSLPAQRSSSFNKRFAQVPIPDNVKQTVLDLVRLLRPTPEKKQLG